MFRAKSGIADVGYKASQRWSGMYVAEVFDVDGTPLRSFKTDPIGLTAPNGITNAGIEDNEAVYFVAGTQKPLWYFGLINSTSYTALAAGDTMASHGGWIELTDYDETTRQVWAPSAPSGRIVASVSSATFTISATVTIKGAFLVSSSTKGGTAGTLWSTGLFGVAQSLIDNQTLRVSYTLTGTSGS
jgi:hypothetical protein